MDNIIEIVNRSQAINAEIRMIRQRSDLTLADYKHLAELQADLLSLCPVQRYVWLAGRPVIDLFCELARPIDAAIEKMMKIRKSTRQNYRHYNSGASISKLQP